MRLEEIDNNISIGAYEITDFSNVVFDNGVLKGKKDGRVTISVELKAGCENYLFYTGGTDCIKKIEVENGCTKEGRPISPLAINLGAVKEDRKAEIAVVFNQDAAFDKDSLQIIYLDLSKYAEYIDAMKKDTEGRFFVGINKVNGTVELGQDKIVCFSAPYSLGWHARIDEKEVEVYPVNDLFMGVLVPKGNHKIEMYYVTPGIRVGTAVSIASLVVILVIILHKNWKKTE